ncbi:hypothetical protein ACFSJY_02410 [Thalassotalea euphylliae]|uniref:hypothetical protein n=1 Tax=Thalassotalea euphylliae TaxID=1655234 RepID=UPI00362E6DE4
MKTHIKNLLFISALMPIGAANALCDLHGGFGGFGMHGGYRGFDAMSGHRKASGSVSAPRIMVERNQVTSANESGKVKVGYLIAAAYKNVELKFSASPGVTIESKEVVTIDGLRGQHLLVYRVEKPGNYSIDIETSAVTTQDSVYSDKQKINITAL